MPIQIVLDHPLEWLGIALEYICIYTVLSPFTISSFMYIQIVLSLGGKPTDMTAEWFFITMLGPLVALNFRFGAEN